MRVLFAAALCALNTPLCASELTLCAWQKYPALMPTDEHVSPLCSETRRKDRPKCVNENLGHISWPAIAPRTAGLHAAVRMPAKAAHRLLIGAGVTHQNSFKFVFKTGLVIAAFPLAPVWDAGGFGSPAFARMTPAESADPEDDGDWTHHRLLYGGELDKDEAAFMDDEDPFLAVTLSRLCPGVLFETNTGGLSFFQGLPPYAESIPVAVKTKAGVEIVALGVEQEMELPSAEWVLLFWGAIPPQRFEFPYESGAPVAQDRPPVLFVFSEAPVSIGNGDNITFRFAEQSVKAVMFPLFGVDFPGGVETEKWKNGLPAEVERRCDEWAGRLASFPVSALESYSYDAAADVVECVERVKHEQVRENGAPWAPLPPMVMLARDKLPMAFEPAPSKDVYCTAYGPLAVVDDTDTVKWRFSGLRPYVFGRPVLGPPNAQSQELERELGMEMDRIFEVPYLAPWVFENWRFNPGAEVYWRTPGETAYYLAQALPALDEAHRAKLGEYLAAFHERFPFLEIAALPVWLGPKRARHYTGADENGNNEALPEKDYKYAQTISDPSRITFNVVSGLDAFYEATGKAPDEEAWGKASALLENSLLGADWASGLWTQGHAPELPPKSRSHRMDIELPARCLQRHLAALLGFLRMSNRCGKGGSDAASLAWGRLARGFAARAGLAKYAAWLKPPAGVADYGNPLLCPGTSHGYATWVNIPAGNAVWLMNQFAVHLADSSSRGRKSVYIDYLEMPPEVGRFLGETAREETTLFLDAVDRSWPLWWTANMSSELGNDSNGGLVQPINAHSLFMAGAWIRGDGGEKLRRRLDFSWLERGDLFYIHKLAETVKTLRGVEWAVD